jgi:molybdopterin-guanine dinucleotide biosynthesis protein A
VTGETRNVVAAIMAGGQGARIGGAPKGRLVVAGETIVARQLRSLRARFSRIVIVTNDPNSWADLGLPMIPDRVRPGGGPLAGVDAALAALAADESDIVCVGGDMPFLHPVALELVRDHAPFSDAVVPRVGEHAEPLFARYHRRCADIARDQLSRGSFKMTDFLARVQVSWIEEKQLRSIDPDLGFLANVNTPEDLVRAERLAQGS